MTTTLTDPGALLRAKTMDELTMAEQTNLVLTILLEGQKSLQEGQKDIQKEQGILNATVTGIDVKVDGIGVQTTKTNGRMNSAEDQIKELKKHIAVLEQERAQDKAWLNGSKATLIVISAALGFIIKTIITLIK